MITDPDFLRNQQYASSANLDARIAVHKLFSSNPYGWFPWLFDQIRFSADCRILELGSGPGEFWLHNLDRAPAGMRLILSDLSFGMLEKARSRLPESPLLLGYPLIDAQELPFDDCSFDLVFANHMLYHLSDRQKALNEIFRVLVQGGCLVATTVGERHMAEISDIVSRFDIQMSGQLQDWEITFSLETGAAELAQYFSGVELKRYPDSLVVNQAAPLTDYILSSFRSGISPDRRSELLAFIDREIRSNNGEIHITKDAGAFICTKD